MIIAIDGPAGSGKSTVAKEVARRLGYHYLDTGAMYRALACCALRSGVVLTDGDALVALARRAPIEFGFEEGEVLPSRVFIGGTEVTRDIRTPEIDRAVSPTSAHPQVRAAMVDQQRALGATGDYVVEGRDIGTVVFPEAPVKVFVTASAQERARRRAEQNLRRGMEGDFTTIYQAILARDKADTQRAVAPLVAADDATVIDTTELAIDEVIDRIVDQARTVRDGRR